MGLVICKKIVEINEGRITVMSKGLERGSTFQFTMKMSIPEEILESSPSVVSRNQLLIREPSNGISMNRLLDASFSDKSQAADLEDSSD